MYYYLDQEDGYSKGPITWEELKRLPLEPGTHIFNAQNGEWRTLEDHLVKMAAEAKAAVKSLPRSYSQEVHTQPSQKRPSPVPTAEPWRTEPKPLTIPKPKVAPVKQQQLPKSVPTPYDKQRPIPQAQPDQYDTNPMGVSGMGCFIWAVLIALVMGLLFGVLWWN